MEKINALIELALKDIPALPEEEMRLKRLATLLRDLNAESVARFFALLYSRGAHNLSVRAVMNLLVDPEGLKNELGEERYREAYRVSERLGLGRVGRLFTDAEPYRTGVHGYDKEEEAAMEFISLGQRRAMSKKSDRNLLDRMLSDPDPMVIINILNNQRTTEREVVKVASKRPNSPVILKILALHRVWSKRYGVIKAITLNPYAYPRVSVVLAEFLHSKDLKAAIGDNNIHPQVRLAAMEIIRERAGA